ncbi:hypothetical protein C2G38_2239640 [Gigaspora rosea]|uniref:Uncharacterized protein n=1 Tax=Gigaspora rosea TaxID=44941 RepID=A0A397W4D2_9GLOM|nr:hypothetical protein C2G38_2239640 [Gigaspora rosea]
MSRENIIINIVASTRSLSSLSEEPNKLSEDEEGKLLKYLIDKDTNVDDVEKNLNLCETNDAKLGYLKELSKKKPDRENERLTLQELLRTVLPVPTMHLINIKSTTKRAARRKIPNYPVLAWNDFLTEAFNASKRLDANDRKYNRPNVIEEWWLSVEDSVVDMFLKTMKATNNQRLITLSPQELWSRCFMFWAIKGQPDAIRCAGGIQLLNASLLLSVVEIETEQLMRTLVDDETELFNAYNTALRIKDDGTTEYTRHQKIIRIVKQLFGYMVVNDLKYGLLTTYIRTWFFYHQVVSPNDHDSLNILYISPAVYINQSHTGDSASFLECMYYFERISTMNPTTHYSLPNIYDGDYDYDGSDDNENKHEDEDDKNTDEYRPPSSKNILKRTSGVTIRSQSKKRKVELNDNEFLNSMKNHNRNQFSFGDVLRNGQSGTILMAKLHEQVGVLKMVDLYKKEYPLQEILNEIKMYLGPLKEIQGIYIPKLLKYGFSMRHLLLYLHRWSESHLQILKISQKKKSSWPLMVYWQYTQKE